MHLYTLLFAAVALVACNRPTTPTTPLNTQFVLAPGEARVIEDTGGAEVRFNGVANDSRCPADAVCVTGGDAHVQIRVASGLSTREYVLHTGDMKPVTHDDLTIHLVEVAPYPFSSRTIAQSDYRVTLRVTR